MLLSKLLRMFLKPKETSLRDKRVKYIRFADDNLFNSHRDGLVLIKLIKKYLHHRKVRKQSKVFYNFVKYQGWGYCTELDSEFAHIFWINFDPNNQWYIEEALHEDFNELMLTGVEVYLGGYTI